MKVTIISDTHSMHSKVRFEEETDLLVHCGDFSGYGTEQEAIDFIAWFKKQPFKHKIVVPGNHDFYVVKNTNLFKNLANNSNIEVLIDKLVDVEGKQIYGTPWVSRYGMWAYMRDDLGWGLERTYSMIPEGLDLLICHGPPYKILDKTDRGDLAGSRSFRKYVFQKAPKNVCFGHIHEGYGKHEEKGIKFYNASFLDEHYKPKNEPIVIII